MHKLATNGLPPPSASPWPPTVCRGFAFQRWIPLFRTFFYIGASNCNSVFTTGLFDILNIQPSHVYRRKPFIKVKVDILVPLTIIAIFVEMTLNSDQNSDPDQSVGRLPQFMPFSRGHSDISNRGDNCSYHQPTITSDFRKRLNFCIL